MAYDEGIRSELFNRITVAYCLGFFIEDQKQVAVKFVVEFLGIGIFGHVKNS